MIAIVFLYAVCALTFTLAKVMVSTAAPFFFVAIRMLCAGLILAALSFFTGQWKKIRSADWWIFLQIAFFAIFIAYVGDLWSLQFITSIESALVFNISPLITALLSFLWFKERMTKKKWLGMGVGFLSLIPLLSKQFQAHYFFSSQQIIPIIILMIAVASGAYGWVMVRELVKNRAYPILMVNSISMVVGGFFSLLLSMGVEWGRVPLVGDSWRDFIILTLIIILVANLIFTNLYGFLLSRYTATLLSISGLLCPLFTALLGWYFLGEALSWRFLWAALGAALGLYLFYEEELRLGYLGKTRLPFLGRKSKNT